MSILFDAHEDPTAPQTKQYERYPMPMSNAKKYDDLLIFGYQCKLFRDDQISAELDRGQFLIPWMGNKDLMIDRYDCRGHLYRLEEFDLENLKDLEPLSSEQLDIENVCDEERYMDLRRDMSAENILQEEEDKRGSALYDPFTAYQNIEYSYEDSTSGKALSECNSNPISSTNDTYVQFCLYYGYDPNDMNLKAYFQSQSVYQYDYERPPPPPEPAIAQPVAEVKLTYAKFIPPPGIEIPDGIELPETRKSQSIIEKTAMFISKQSAQMEIVLKTKQSGNPQFAFLDFGNYLNPYYKFILGKIKEGEYEYVDDVTDSKEEAGKKVTENENGKDENSTVDSDNQSNSDDDDDHELHPLLQAHRRPLIQNKTGSSSPPPPVSKDPEKQEPEKKEPVANQVPHTKMTGKVEDLAKVYMTYKYTPNPETQLENSETDEDEEDQPQLEGVEALPPPPPPPALSNLNDSTPEKVSPVPSTSAPSPPPSPKTPEPKQDPPTPRISEPQPEPVEKGTMSNELSQTAPEPPNFTPHPSISHSFEAASIPHIRFPPSQLGQQPYLPRMGQPFLNNMPSHFQHHFQTLPHQLPYPYNLYQVRTMPPPPPPPPPILPSLMPPGVDVPVISAVNITTTQIANTTTCETAAVVTSPSVSQSSTTVSSYVMPDTQDTMDDRIQSDSTEDESLLPPGVEMLENSLMPPPPPPPLPPIVNPFNKDSPPETVNHNKSPTDKRRNRSSTSTVKTSQGKQQGKRELDHGSTNENDKLDSDLNSDRINNTENNRPIPKPTRSSNHSPQCLDSEDQKLSPQTDSNRKKLSRSKKRDGEVELQSDGNRKVLSKSKKLDGNVNAEMDNNKKKFSKFKKVDDKVEPEMDSNRKKSSKFKKVDRKVDPEMDINRKKSSKFKKVDGKIDPPKSNKVISHPISTCSPSTHVESNAPRCEHSQLPSCSFQNTTSPFDQINQTLKSMQNHLEEGSQNDAHNIAPLPTKIVSPGKDLQLVIDRLALYVAKNGEEFEVGIKDKKDPRFDFLNPWNIYHPYYLDKKKINLEAVENEKLKEEERKRNLKVKFGLKAKVKGVTIAKEKSATVTAAVFNQNEDEEVTEAPTEGFQPNKDPEMEVKRRLQKQIEEKEKLLKQLQEQAILQQKIAEVNRLASAKPTQSLTPQQQALLKRKVQANLLKKDLSPANSKIADERKKRAASFVDMVNKQKLENAGSSMSSQLGTNFLRKRHFKETSGSKSDESQPPDKVSSEKRKDAFFKAINDAFKGT